MNISSLKLSGTANDSSEDIDERLVNQIFEQLFQLNFSPNLAKSKLITALTTECMYRLDIMTFMVASIDPRCTDLANQAYTLETQFDKVKVLTAILSTLGLCRTDDFALINGRAEVSSQMSLWRKISCLLVRSVGRKDKSVEVVKDEEEALATHVANIMFSLDGSLLYNNMQKSNQKAAEASEKVVSEKVPATGLKPKKVVMKSALKSVKAKKVRKSETAALPSLESLLSKMEVQLAKKRAAYKEIVDSRGTCVCTDELEKAEDFEDARKSSNCLSVDCAQAKVAFVEQVENSFQMYFNQEPPEFDISGEAIQSTNSMLKSYLACMKSYSKLQPNYEQVVSINNSK